MSSVAAKKRPRSEIGSSAVGSDAAEAADMSSDASFFVQLQSLDGVPTGGTVEVPGSTTPAQLE